MQIGAYRLEAELARGGMGVVYRGRGPDGEAVAIKLLLEQSFPDPELERRFGREARALEALNHPGILRVRTHGVDRGRLFMVMDLLSGPTLAEVVEAEGPLPEARAVELGRRLAAALAHAHRRGIVHRDLKPENVILEGEAPVLVDFGLVRQLGFDASRLTETGTILGSPNYMAPEQTLGEGEVGPAADVYALGATLYFLLTGKPPFEGASVLAVLSQVAGEAPTPPSAHRPGLDPTLEALVLRCLEKAPEQRYPSAVVLGAALDGVGDPLPAGAARPGRRSSAPLLLFAVSLALALGAALAALLASPGPGRASELLSAAKAELEAGRYAEALAACEEAIRLEPEVARAHALRGSIRALRSEHIAAIADLDRALELDPALANAYAQRAVSELNLGRLSEAIADCDRALELGVQTPADVYLCRGACKERLARYEDALADYDQALGHDPDFVPALLSRGVCHSRLGHEAEAEASYTAVIERAPDAARAWSNRGKLRLNQGRRAEAIQDLERALELAPDDVETLISRGLCSEEDSETAIRYFTLAIELDPRSATAIVYRGVAQLKVGRLGEGLTDLERGLELDPGNALARLNRGNALRAMGREEEALADYDAGLASDELRGQTRATVQGVRDRLAAKLAGGNAPAGDPSAALAERTTPRELPRWDAAQRIEALDRALARDPDDARAHARRGRSKASLGHHAEALADYARALELDPRGFKAWGDLGWSAQRLGRHERALAAYGEALEADPADALVWARRAASQRALGRAEEAVADCGRALARFPAFPQARLERAEALVDLERFDDALADLEEALRGGLAPAQARLARAARDRVRAAIARQPGRGPTPEASAQALARLQAAAAAFSAGRVDEAHAAYEEVIELDPANPTAFGGRGVSRVYQNRLVEALADYDLGIELGQRGVPAGLYVNRGLCLGRLGRHAAALADFERVLGLEPEHVGALSSRAHCLAQLERHEEALADFDAALRLGPPSATLHVNRGTSLAALGRCEEALADYDAALAWRGASGLSPAQADALRGFREIARGDAIALRRAVSTRAREAALERLLAANRQFERERFEDARASCDEALRQDPGRGEAYLLRGICQLRLGRYSEAVEDLNRARLLGVEGVKLYSNRGQALASLAAHAAATLDFSRVLELEPGNTEARALRGISKVALADPGSALVDLEVALAEDPGHTTAHLFRGVTLADFGRYAEALEDYDAALALGLPPEQVEVARTQRDQAELARAKAEPPTPGSRALGYATEGGALFAGGRYEEALAQFDRALAEDPDDPMHSLRRGACKVALQRFGEAVVDFDRALALEPALVVARTNRALARLNLGRFDEALADYAEVLEFEPRSVNALMGRASCLARQEKFSEAVGDLDRALALGGLPEGVAEQVRRQRERWAAEAAR